MSSRVYIFYIGLLLFILIFSAWFFARTRRGKSKLRLIAAEFGKNVIVKVGISSFEVEFEREGTVFKSSIVSTKYRTTYALNFYLPQIEEKIYIRQNSSIASFRAVVDESRFSPFVSVPDLSDDYLVLSPNPDFLRKLLSNQAILAEINSLGSVFNYPQILFEDGHFRIRLEGTGWNSLEKFRHLCRTATSFHDGIRQMS